MVEKLFSLDAIVHNNSIYLHVLESVSGGGNKLRCNIEWVYVRVFMKIGKEPYIPMFARAHCAHPTNRIERDENNDGICWLQNIYTI